MSLGPISLVTILTPNLKLSADMYLKAFYWDLPAEIVSISESEAARWGATKLAGARSLIVSGINGGVRFIESHDSIDLLPLRTCGWTALEICVDDVFAYTERAISAGFKLLNKPNPLNGTGKLLPLIAAQLSGLNGEVVYITQILSKVPNFELPDVEKESGSVFICVLGASNLEASREILEETFNLRRASDREVAIQVINKVYEKDLNTLHRLSSLQLDGRNAIEIDQMPNEAIIRVFSEGYLPGGISIVSVLADISEPKIVRLPDNALLEILPN